MKLRRWIVCLLVLSMVTAVVPLSAGAESVVASGSWGGPTSYWELTSDGTLTISGSSRMDALSAEYYPWVKYADQITKVVIAEGIESISRYAFSNLHNLARVDIGNTVREIKEYAFEKCEKLQEVNFSSNLEVIESGAFYGCSSLKLVKIPSSTQEIGGTAFFECTSLSSLTFGANSELTTIGGNAFAYTAITSVEIPPSVTHIGDYAFENCHQLTTVKLVEGIKSIGKYAFDYCPKLTGTLYLPSTLTTLGERAFGDVKSWTNVIIFTSEAYDQYYFSGNTHLKTLTIGGKATDVCDDAFENCSALESVTISIPVERIGFRAFNGCSALSKVEFPETLKEIWAYAFCATGVKEVKLPDLLEYIGYGVFKDCAQLVWAKCGNGVRMIDNFAFENCTSLEYIDLCNVQEINEGAFRNCGSLASVTFPTTVAYLGSQAFANCETLAAITFVGDAPAFGSDDVFSGITATVYYPAENATWTARVMQNYGGKITWVAYDSPAYRLYGDNRWATSLEVADEMKANLGVEKFDTIIIASGMNFADALSGSYLATVKNAPILLCWSGDAKYDYLNDDIIAYVESNLTEGGTVYILGGTSAVPESLETGLEGISVKRLAGENRFETNLEILKEAGVTEGQEILVCTGTGFADSLSASAAGLPILMVFNELTEGQTAYLSTLSGNTFCVIGGGNAVNASIETAVGTYGTTTRLAGENRFETSVMVAEKYFENPESVVLAYAWNYPDGLCGGVLAYSAGAPLILTMDKYEAEAAGYIQGQGIEKGLVLGGTGLISDDTVRTIFAMDAEAPVPTK